jgi:hypothetical protein
VAVSLIAALLLAGCSNERSATPGEEDPTVTTAPPAASVPSESPSPEPTEPGVLKVKFGKPVNIESPDEGTIRVVVSKPKVSFGSKTVDVTVKSLVGKVDVDYWELMAQGSDGTLESLGSFSSNVSVINKGQQIKREFYFPDSLSKDKGLDVYVAEDSDNSVPVAIWE